MTTPNETQANSMDVNDASADVTVVNDTCVIDCSGMQPLPVNSVVDDAVIEELSSRFANVQTSDPATSNVTLVNDTSDPVASASLSEELSKAEAAKFNEVMEVISRFAEDVVKTWLAKMYNRDLKEVFPDGLSGHTASIRMIPGPDLIAERRAALGSPEEETREGNPDDGLEEFKRGWELKLAVVDSNYRINLNDWRKREPDVLRLMGDLLSKARSYVAYALEAYELPNPELFANTIIPSQFGTLYVLGAPHDSPQIGVLVERIKPE